MYLYDHRSNAPEVLLESINGSQAKAYRVIVNQIGTSVILLDADTQTAVSQAFRDEWGSPLLISEPGRLPIGFAGCLYDYDTNLCHLGAREYDPETGRWMQRDSILFGGGDTNLYGYVLNDPINYADPTGKFGILEVAATIAAVSAIVYVYYDIIHDKLVPTPTDAIINQLKQDVKERDVQDSATRTCPANPIRTRPGNPPLNLEPIMNPYNGLPILHGRLTSES